MRDANYPLQAKRGRSPARKNIVTMHVHVCVWFIITLPIVIKPLGYYYPFMALQQRRMRQDGLGVLSIPGYSCPKAMSLTKINIDEDLTHSNIKVFKLTL